MSSDQYQQAIIDKREGFVVADAGPGTGKTHTVTQRSLAVLMDGLSDPSSRSAMLTFTRNAAAEMEERLLAGASGMLSSGEITREQFKNLSSKIKQMFIGTFDSFCLNIVKAAPWEISAFFGFKESLTTNASTTENETLNRVFFRRFISQWLEDYGTDPKYGEYPAIVSGNADDLYDLINRLMCMGIIPLKMGGWFGGTPRPWGDPDGPAGEPAELRGDPGKVLEGITAWSDKRRGKDNSKDFAECYDSVLMDGFDTSLLDGEFLGRAARDDRGALLATIHDVYYRYMEKCISTDHLTFGLTACFAFVALYQNKAIREKAAVDNLIVDEFQDTNTLQMMIAMMVLRKPNLCVVGDWRQGIYGFRYVSPENILNFHRRLVSLRAFLNDDGLDRVCYPVPDEDGIAKIQLSMSYRSSKTIVHGAYQALVAPATKDEKMDPGYVKEVMDGEIETSRDELLKDDTAIYKIVCGDSEGELKEVVHRVMEYVGKKRVFDRDDTVGRPAGFGDIAVLCRSTRNCRAVYRALRAHNIPAFLQGDMEIMNTIEGKLLLAWMRFVENISDARGFVPILGYLGYSAAEIREMRESKKLPAFLLKEQGILEKRRRRITDFTTSVFAYHGISNDVSQAIIEVLSSVHKGSLMTISEIITMIELDIANKTRYNVDGQPDSDAVNVLTMHKSKGLEYPIVIIPFVDTKSFPSYGADKGVFRYSKDLGVRCTRTLVTMADGSTELNGSWKTRLATLSGSTDYDEERRLFFVAVSRAKQYVDLIAGSPSMFFKSVDGTPVPCFEGELGALGDASRSTIDAPDVSYGFDRPRTINVHDLMGSQEVEAIEPVSRKGRGMNYGTHIHNLAQVLVNGGTISREDEELDEVPNLREAVKSLPEGERFTEVPCNLNREVDGRIVSVAGSIDLLVVGEDRAYVYDWKTDVNDAYRENYVIQLSAYAKCVSDEYPGKKVEAAIVWLSHGDLEIDPVEILGDGEIVDVMREAVAAKE